jgi:hypothetical protein
MLAGWETNSWTKNTRRANKRVWRLWYTVKSNEHWARTFAWVRQLRIYSLYNYSRGLPLSHQHSYPTLSSALNIFCNGVFLLLLKTAFMIIRLSNFYAIGFLWRRCNFRGKCHARYCDVAKTTCGIRQSNYLPLLLYRIPLTGVTSIEVYVSDVTGRRFEKVKNGHIFC